MKELSHKFVEVLMASFLYYIHDTDSPLSDSEYDSHCRDLLEGWDSFEHPHKYLATASDMRAGTLYALRDYPLQTQSAAWSWRKDHICEP